MPHTWSSRRPDRRPLALPEMLESRMLMADTLQNVQIGGGGYVTGLAASSDGSGIYMRTDVGGAYRWNAAISTWNPITDTLPPDVNNGGHLYGISAIAVDPANANRVFIATGKYDWSSPSGLYYTTNADAPNPTWTVLDSTIRAYGNGSPIRQNGERLAVDPNNPNVLYYGTTNITNYGVGLKKYLYGTTWAGVPITTPANGDSARGIAFVTADKNGGTVVDGNGQTVSRYLYAGVYSDTAGNGGVYASSDGGVTWTKTTGLTNDKLARGEVGVDGTLYVTYDGGVGRLTRGSTTFTLITPPGGNTDFCSLAADPVAPGIVMVADFTFSGTGRIWRSLDSGTTWFQLSRSIKGTEPDGTPSATGNGSADHVSDLMINPANTREVWLGDFLGVSMTPSVADNATTVTNWYTVQRGHEEVVVLDMKSAPSGASLATAVADVNGFMHDDVSDRPTKRDQFDNPGYLSTTSIDFSEATSGTETVWARVGQLYYGDGPAGGSSTDGGRNWVNFGELDRRSILNATTAGWEEFDVAPYLKQQKAAGISTVTLVLRSDSWQTNQTYLKFSSKEGTNAPRLLVNGSQSITVSEDAGVYANNTGANYGTATSLTPRNYYDQAWTHWQVYLKFDLSSATNITSAKLQLYRIAGDGAYSFATRLQASANASWTESTVTWANRPTDLTAPPTGFYDRGGRVAVSATDPSNITWYTESGKLWYSKDRGVRWAEGKVNGYTIWGTGVTEFQQDKVALASDRMSADTFYLYNRRVGEIYRSTTGGATWTVLATGVGQPESYKLETVPGIANRFWFLTQSWNMADKFRYWNGSSLVTVPGITNVVDFTFGKPAPGRTNPVVYVRKSDFSYWYSVDATAGSTYTWKKVNAPVVANGPRVMEGDRQTAGRFYVGTDGRGAYYYDVDMVAPTVSSITINGGAAQRSIVKTLGITFSEPVTLAPDAIQVKTKDGLAPANTMLQLANPSGDQMTYVITFTVSGAVGGSLPDGVYDVVVQASGVQDLSANAMASNSTQRFHRLFGDINGDRAVNMVDYTRIRAALGRTAGQPLFNAAFDFDGNDAITVLDLAQFRRRFGMVFRY